MKENPEVQVEQLKELILKILEENKAEDIVNIDLAGKTDIAQYMIIASGRSSKHVGSTAEFVAQHLKTLNISSFIEGMNNSNWVLLDTGEILVHIFDKETREKYSLEDLWQRERK